MNSACECFCCSSGKRPSWEGKEGSAGRGGGTPGGPGVPEPHSCPGTDRPHGAQSLAPTLGQPARTRLTTDRASLVGDGTSESSPELPRGCGGVAVPEARAVSARPGQIQSCPKTLTLARAFLGGPCSLTAPGLESGTRAEPYFGAGAQAVHPPHWCPSRQSPGPCSAAREQRWTWSAGRGWGRGGAGRVTRGAGQWGARPGPSLLRAFAAPAASREAPGVSAESAGAGVRASARPQRPAGQWASEPVDEPASERRSRAAWPAAAAASGPGLPPPSTAQPAGPRDRRGLATGRACAKFRWERRAAVGDRGRSG